MRTVIADRIELGGPQQ